MCMYMYMYMYMNRLLAFKWGNICNGNWLNKSIDYCFYNQCYLYLYAYTSTYTTHVIFIKYNSQNLCYCICVIGKNV